jgi:hypothetical protein
MTNEWHWQGASGVWYRHLVWDLPSSLTATPANYIAVRRGRDGTRRAIFIGQTDDLERCWRDHIASGLLAEALELGANEIHLNCAARDRTERTAMEWDLLQGHDAPLNRPRKAARADPIVELANLLNARSAATGRQTPLWAQTG